jgi:hypothetical protein
LCPFERESIRRTERLLCTARRNHRVRASRTEDASTTGRRKETSHSEMLSKRSFFTSDCSGPPPISNLAAEHTALRSYRPSHARVSILRLLFRLFIADCSPRCHPARMYHRSDKLKVYIRDISGTPSAVARDYSNQEVLITLNQPFSAQFVRSNCSKPPPPLFHGASLPIHKFCAMA